MTREHDDKPENRKNFSRQNNKRSDPSSLEREARLAKLPKKEAVFADKDETLLVDETGAVKDPVLDVKSPRVEPGTIIKDPTAPEVIEKVISIKRITKVTKGGKKLSFSALVVVGDAMGKVGYSHEKASEVSIAIRKALIVAKKNMIKIPIKGSTIPHEIIGMCGGAEVLLKPAAEGTGVIASGTVRAVCDGAGIHNILTKCHRSNNPVNVVKATFDGLTRLKSARK
ncbi:MAG: 30S ribosomal protein S5 [Candidatus Omnitrophica bacterium]|nr:30S ribosomal protein S5 [Candidatus Omnitrophota bacterium]